jgi:hypothetical protein
MRSLWTLLSVLAVANLLALAALVGWLGATHRLSAERIRAFKEVLVETVPDQNAREAGEAAKKEADLKLAAAKAKENKPPMTAQEKLAVRLEATELDMQRYKKLQSDIEAMQTNLRAQAERLNADRAAFEADKAAFLALRKELEGKTADEQFKKTLATLEAMDTKNAVNTVLEILAGAGLPPASPTGAAASQNGEAATPSPTPETNPGEDRALRYLNAMTASKRSEIVNMLGKTQPALAAKLLERLRTYGVITPAAGTPPP